MFKKFAKFYNHILNRYTYPVQMASAGTLWFSGDLLCQCLVIYSKKESAVKIKSCSCFSICNCNNTTSLSSSPSSVEEKSFLDEIDWLRATRMTLYGTFFSAPIYTCWFTLLEKLSIRTFKSYPISAISSTLLKTPSHPPSAKVSHATSRLWKITAFKTFLDVIVFDPFYLSFFFLVTGLMENKTLRDVKYKLELDLTTTYVVDVAVWLPIQFANFRYIPVLYQPLVVQGLNLFWNAFLSFIQHKEIELPHTIHANR